MLPELRRLRQACGIDERELARQLHIPLATLMGYERHGRVTGHILRRLARFAADRNLPEIAEDFMRRTTSK